MNESHFEAILCIVNTGFSDTVMDAAKTCGARGGTVFRANGTATKETEKKYGILIEPEKEIVLILVDSAIRDEILHAVYRAAGQGTAAQGIAFSLPVSGVAGLFDNKHAR